MTATERPRETEPTTALGTLGWVGVVVICAVAALIVLSWLGPVGTR